MDQRSMLCCLVLVAGSLGAQCQGSGGSARLEQTPLALGTTVTTRVFGNSGATYFVYLSDALSITTVPGLGVVCLDLTTPTFQLIYSGAVPPSGVAPHSALVPNTMLWHDIVFFMQGVVTDASEPLGLALTNTLRKDYETPNAWQPLPPLPTGTVFPTATRLDERGWVFIAGGTDGPARPSFGPGIGPLAQAETSVYFPLLRGAYPGPNLAVPRSGHTATALLDGRVLIAGGFTNYGGGASGDVLLTCEIFDPATFSMTPAAPMNHKRSNHTATLLDDGRVLVTGGFTLAGTDLAELTSFPRNDVELYDPTTNSWTSVVGALQIGKAHHTATRLTDGRVLLAGGVVNSQLLGLATILEQMTSSCDLFDPVTNQLTPAPSLLVGRAAHQATALPDGRVLASGGTADYCSIQLAPNPGCNVPGVLATTEIFDGVAWTAGPVMNEARAYHRQVALPGGRLLVSGGALTPYAPVDTCEIFDGIAFTPTQSMAAARRGHAAVALNDGSVLAAGGDDMPGVVPPSGPNLVAGNTVELFTPLP